MIRLHSDKNVNYMKITSIIISIYAVFNLRMINRFWSIINAMANEKAKQSIPKVVE